MINLDSEIDIKSLLSVTKSYYEELQSLIFVDGIVFFYELPVDRLPNKKQTACEACPGNLVANSTIAECWCPLGDLIFNKHFDNCEYSIFVNLIYSLYSSVSIIYYRLSLIVFIFSS